jgi:DNA repair protein RadC
VEWREFNRIREKRAERGQSQFKEEEVMELFISPMNSGYQAPG